VNNSSAIKRLDTSVHPFPSLPSAPGYHQREAWPATWIASNDCVRGVNHVTAYRLRFSCEKTVPLRVFVTADQRYWLYLDGRRIGLGSERGCMRQWFYETYEISVSEGPHTLGAITWYLPENPSWAQASAQPGFLLAAEAPFTDQISTGLAPWESRVLKTVAFLDPTQQIGQNIGCGARVRYEGASWADVLECDQIPWSGVHQLLPGNNAFWQGASPQTWVLHPARLPAMRLEKRGGAAVVLVSPAPDAAEPLKLGNTIRAEAKQWQAMLEGRASGLHVPPHTSRRVLIDLRDYFCAYYALTTEGGEGSEISVAWAERLSTKPDAPIAPSERRTVDGLFFVGTADQFCPRNTVGRVSYEPLWWQAGRWVQITVTTAAAPLIIHGFNLLETGYPLVDESRFQSNDEILNAIAPVCYRTLQACAHETYMDCPYWEQLQYVGDTRIQALLTYVTSHDARLPEKALEIFRHSMTGASPFPASNYPSRKIQIIPPFALWWICMLHDYALWRGNRRFVKELMPMGWWILDHFLLLQRDDGLVESPAGWNYVDAVAFKGGEPPGAFRGGVSGVINWQVILALNALRDLSQWLGDTHRAALAEHRAAALTVACEQIFWDPQRQALADDLAHQSFSEHTQALALLTERLSVPVQALVQQALVGDTRLLRAGSYFSHYICLALRQIGAGNELHTRFHVWRRFLDAGFHTFPEGGIEGRSDCHAWSAHPLFHMLSSVLGIRPATCGFETVLIAPVLGPLLNVSGSMPHPKGDISVSIAVSERGGVAEVTLPIGLSGTFRWGTQTMNLHEGRQTIEL